jgi:hypothetical protein
VLVPVLGSLVLGLLAGPLAGAGPAAAADPTPSPSEPGLLTTLPEARSSGPAAATVLPVQVSITAITPIVVRPGADVHVTATVRNTGPVAVAEPRAVVHLQRKGFVSRSSLDTWRTADPAATLGTTVATVDLPGPLAPGQSASVAVTVPAAALGLPTSSSSWGARGLGVELVDVADASRARVGVARSFLVWYPAEVATRTTLSILVPVTGPAPGPGAAEELTALTSGGGRLADVLDATAGAPGVAWAVDPWVVDLAVHGPAQLDGAAAIGRADRSAKAADAAATPAPAAPGWGAQLIAAADSHEVRLLTWGDADVPALTHAAAGNLLAESVERAAGVASDLGLHAAGLVVLDGDEDPDRATVGAARSLDAPYVVAPGRLAPPSVLTYTPTGSTTVPAAQGPGTVLVPDERLSRGVATGSVLGPRDPAPAVEPVRPTGATAAADLLAELAVVTRERPNTGRHLLATVPRDWEPDVPATRAALAALGDAPFLTVGSLAGLAAAPDPSVDRGEVVPVAVDGSEVTSSLLEQSADAVAARAGLADMLAVPATALGDTQAERLAVAARAWRDDPAGRRALVADSVARNQALHDGVEVAESRDVNLLSSTGTLPLQIANHLDQEVHLTVRLAPSNARLVADKPVDVVVPPRSEVTAQLSVHGVQSADVPTAVQLVSPSGVLINDSTTLLVRVRAEWESIGTAVAGGLLALAFVVGLIRTIRRGRGRGRLGPGSVPPGAAGSEPPTPDPAPAPTSAPTSAGLAP